MPEKKRKRWEPSVEDLRRIEKMRRAREQAEDTGDRYRRRWGGRSFPRDLGPDGPYSEEFYGVRPRTLPYWLDESLRTNPFMSELLRKLGYEERKEFGPADERFQIPDYNPRYPHGFYKDRGFV